MSFQHIDYFPFENQPCINFTTWFNCINWMQNSLASFSFNTSITWRAIDLFCRVLKKTEYEICVNNYKTFTAACCCMAITYEYDSEDDKLNEFVKFVLLHEFAQYEELKNMNFFVAGQLDFHIYETETIDRVLVRYLLTLEPHLSEQEISDIQHSFSDFMDLFAHLPIFAHLYNSISLVEEFVLYYFSSYSTSTSYKSIKVENDFTSTAAIIKTCFFEIQSIMFEKLKNDILNRTCIQDQSLLDSKEFKLDDSVKKEVEVDKIETTKTIQHTHTVDSENSTTHLHKNGIIGGLIGLQMKLKRKFQQRESRHDDEVNNDSDQKNRVIRNMQNMNEQKKDVLQQSRVSYSNYFSYLENMNRNMQIRNIMNSSLLHSSLFSKKMYLSPSEAVYKRAGRLFAFEDPQLEIKIGSGSEGEVYLARFPDTVTTFENTLASSFTTTTTVTKNCVVKCFIDSSEGSFREIAALMLLKSENILEIYDAYWNLDNKIEMAVELMELSLHTFLHGGVCSRNIKVSPHQNVHTKRIFMQICSGLQVCHSKKIMHRDLKPDNILLSFESQYPIVKIADFGLCARFSEYDQPHSYLKTVCTFWYRAPELFFHEQPKYDHRIDLWSLGCIFFELFAQRPLFYSKKRNENIGKYESIARMIYLFGEDFAKNLTREDNHSRDVLCNAEKWLVYLKGIPLQFKLLNWSDVEGIVDNAEAFRIIRSLLSYNPKERPECSAILQSVYCTNVARSKK